jgi:hypothetical protein
LSVAAIVPFFAHELDATFPEGAVGKFQVALRLRLPAQSHLDRTSLGRTLAGSGRRNRVLTRYATVNVSSVLQKSVPLVLTAATNHE